MGTPVSPSIPTESSTAVPAGGFSTWFKNIGDWIKSVSPAGATEYDTGRIGCTLTAPWSGSCVARRIGKAVEVKFDLTGGSVAAGAFHVFATLPNGFPVPPGSPGTARGAGLANNLSVQTYVTWNGSAIGFVNDTGATRTSIAGTVIYWVD